MLLQLEWVQMLLQMRPLLHLGPNVITARMGPNVITDETFITLGSSYYTCAFYSPLLPEMNKIA